MYRDLQHLAKRHAADPTPAHREAVVRAAIPFVRALVSRLNVPNHPLASREDLENVGLLGLLQALDSYDPNRTTPFVSYAYGRVRGAVVDYLRSIDALPRKRRRQYAEVQQASDALRQQLGSEPEDRDIAEYLDISLGDYHRLMNVAQRRYTLSLFALTNGDHEQLILDTIPNEEAMEAFEAIDRASLHDYIASLVRQMPEREQSILGLYYYENLRLRDIAQLLDLTEARISQILSKIRLDLRARLTEGHALAA